MYLIEKIENIHNMKYIKCNDNFISEKVEKILLDQLNKNLNLLGL
jgi:hypothetical protein